MCNREKEKSLKRLAAHRALQRTEVLKDTDKRQHITWTPGKAAQGDIRKQKVHSELSLRKPSRVPKGLLNLCPGEKIYKRPGYTG